MDKHYREALIRATVKNLQEVHRIDNPSVKTLKNILEDEYQATEDAECSFKKDVDILTDLYLIFR